MRRNVPPADPVESAAQHVNRLHRCGAALSEAATTAVPVLPGGGWDELTWAYAHAFRELDPKLKSAEFLKSCCFNGVAAVERLFRWHRRGM
jgi:hypothetical protein